MISLTGLLVVGAILFVLYYFFGSSGKKLPPGPIAFPLLGNILQIGKQPHLTFASWVKYYGNVFMVKMMNISEGMKKEIPLVVISDPKVAREAYSSPLFMGAPNLEVFKMFSEGDYGLLSTEGPQWVELRRFTLRHLRDYGFGKNSMESLVMNEVNEFNEMLKAVEGSPVGVKRLLQLAVINSLWSIMGGRRFKLDDKKLNDMLDSSNRAFTETTASPIGIFFPKLAKAFPNASGWNKLLESVKDFQSFIEGFVTEHQKRYNPEDTPMDFTESFLHEMKNCTDPSSTFYKEDGEKNLRATIGGLFGAGSGTTSDTLTFAILYLCTWPEYQKKIQEELDRVVGKSRTVSLEDRKDCLFTQAVIQETLRFSSLAPLGLFHATMGNVKLGDYVVPKGSWVAVNHHYIHTKKEFFGEDAETFNPHRFLSKDGKSIVKNDAMIAFSVGKRQCPGESLARDEIFLFLSNIFHKFEVEFDPKAPKPRVEPEPSLFNTPAAYQVVVRDRLA